MKNKTTVGILQVVVVLFLVSFSCSIFASGDIVGGGEIIGDGINPWFLEVPDQPAVKYCIKVNREYFRQSDEELDWLAEGTLKFWKDHFDTAYIPENSYGDRNYFVRIKTRNFQKVACDESDEISFGVDLVFQLGFLSQPQKELLKKHEVDISRYVAMAVRTDYKKDIMRGRGFIYVSPGSGSDAFQGEDVIEHVWGGNTGSERLQVTILHELGHVYGLRHNNQKTSLMHESFLEHLVSKSGEGYVFSISPPFYPKEGKVTEFCGSTQAPLPSKVRDFFGIPEEHQCVSIVYSAENIVVKSRIDREDTFSQMMVGEARFVKKGDQRFIEAVKLWLPKEQNVFKGLPPYIKMLQGPSITEVQNSGLYVATNQQISRNVFIQTGPSWFQIGGMMGDEIIPDILAYLPDADYLNPAGWQVAK